MASDTILRVASMTKPIVAACAMTLVEDRTLRLDDPVDGFLPEMRVLAEPDGPLTDTVAADRSITLRDLLTFTLGTGMAPAGAWSPPSRRPSPPSARRRCRRRTNSSGGSGRFRSFISRVSAGCTTSPPT